jgi:hypothetical protein
MYDLNKFCIRLLESGLATPESLVGAPEDAVLELETDFGVRLPKPYRDFLRSCGNGCGSFWKGTEFTISDLKRLNLDFRETIDLLQKDGYDLSNLNDAFAINTLSGQAYKFISTKTDVERCPVFVLEISLGSVALNSNSFWDSLESGLESAIRNRDDEIELAKRFRRRN